jgi:hypothetical protein
MGIGTSRPLGRAAVAVWIATVSAAETIEELMLLLD